MRRLWAAKRLGVCGGSAAARRLQGWARVAAAMPEVASSSSEPSGPTRASPPSPPGGGEEPLPPLAAEGSSSVDGQGWFGTGVTRLCARGLARSKIQFNSAEARACTKAALAALEQTGRATDEHQQLEVDLRLTDMLAMFADGDEEGRGRVRDQIDEMLARNSALRVPVMDKLFHWVWLHDPKLGGLTPDEW